MELTGSQRIALPRERVWDALNDPEILKQCIPGCDSFVADGPNVYKLVMGVTVGPITAKFNGTLQLSELSPPESYALSFNGSGGAAGFGKGEARVHLTEEPDHTQLHYAVTAKVGGRLAQVGARLIDGVAKKTADEFFVRFKGLVEPQEPGGVGADGTVEARSEGARDGRATGRDAVESQGALEGEERPDGSKAASGPTPISPLGMSRPWTWGKFAAGIALLTLLIVGVAVYSSL